MSGPPPPAPDPAAPADAAAAAAASSAAAQGSTPAAAQQQAAQAGAAAAQQAQPSISDADAERIGQASARATIAELERHGAFEPAAGAPPSVEQPPPEGSAQPAEPRREPNPNAPEGGNDEPPRRLKFAERFVGRR